MRLGYQRKRVADALRAMGLDREAAKRERWPRERLLRYRQERLNALVRHAVKHSPFHRERLAGLVPAEGAGDVDLSSLPVLTKTEMMESLDRLVTDPRLKRDQLLAHMEALDRDELYLGRYRVLATSGSSGLQGLFVYDRADWSAICAANLRFVRTSGITAHIPRRKLAYLGPSKPIHMSSRAITTMQMGAHNQIQLPVTQPLGELISALQRIQPHALGGFASMVALLAKEQLAGRLRISPGHVMTSAEPCTSEMSAVIQDAWGATPFNLYAMTEAGTVGFDCQEHRGVHLFDDSAIVEVADRDGELVPDGEVGHRLLVTSLHNHVQPVIRLAVSDMVAIDPKPCPCGRPFPLLKQIEGRSDDIVHLPAADGQVVPVHPMHFVALAKAREVREFQVIQEGPALRVRIALHNETVPAVVEARLRTALYDELVGMGVTEPQLSFETCDRIPRDPASLGKLKLVIADPSFTPNPMS